MKRTSQRLRVAAVLLGTATSTLLLTQCLRNGETKNGGPEAAQPARDRVDADGIYAHAELHWPSACLYKPDRQLEGQVELALAPLLLGRGGKGSDPEVCAVYSFGAVASDASGALHVDLTKPTIYYGETTAILHGREYRQLRYQWWTSTASGGKGQGVRMTLDETGRAVIWEILTDASGARLVFVAESLEEAAREEFGEPLQGRRHAVEATLETAPRVIVPRAISPGPVPMGPFLYLDGETQSTATLICRCMPAQFDDLAGDHQYELRPLATLESLGVDTSRWSQELHARADGELPLGDVDDPGWLERCLRLPVF